MDRLKRAIALTLLVGVCCERQVWSAPFDDVIVNPTACAVEPWSVSSWIDLLRVELADDRIAVVLGTPVESGRYVSVDPFRCDARESLATLTCSRHDVRRTRSIDLADVAPVARPRVVAMALAELVRSCDVPDEPTPIPQAAPVRQPATTADVLIDERVRSRSISVDAMGDARVFSRGPVAMFGPRVGGGLVVLDRVGAHVDAGCAFGRAHDSLGTVDAALGSVGGSLLVTGKVGRVMFGIGPRGELGYGWFRGHAATSGVAEFRVTSPLVFVTLSISLSVRISERLRAAVDIDGGTTAYGFAAQADGKSVFDASGPVFVTRIGLTWDVEHR